MTQQEMKEEVYRDARKAREALDVKGQELEANLSCSYLSIMADMARLRDEN